MFHYRGDEVWVNTLPYDPVLDRVTGVLFIVGVAIVLAAVLCAMARHRADPAAGGAGPGAAEHSGVGVAPREPQCGSSERCAARRDGDCRATAVGDDAGDGAALAVAWQSVSTASWGTAILAAVFVAIAQQNASVYFGPYAERYFESANNSSEIARAIQRHSANWRHRARLLAAVAALGGHARGRHQHGRTAVEQCPEEFPLGRRAAPRPYAAPCGAADGCPRRLGDAAKVVARRANRDGVQPRPLEVVLPHHPRQPIRIKPMTRLPATRVIARRPRSRRLASPSGAVRGGSPGPVAR